jgi:hypothetical protein
MDDSDTEDDEGEFSAAVSDDVDDDHIASPTDDVPTSATEHKRTSSVAEDVMAKKGGYGRFAQKWFSRKGWTVGQRRNLGMSISESDTEPGPDVSSSASAPSADSTQKEESVPSASNTDKAKDRDVAENLLPKLLRTTQILFGSSRSFFFSYDYDITRSFANRRTSNSELPLHTEVDPL